jgi:hypothetical protein
MADINGSFDGASGAFGGGSASMGGGSAFPLIIVWLMSAKVFYAFRVTYVLEIFMFMKLYAS